MLTDDALVGALRASGARARAVPVDTSKVIARARQIRRTRQGLGVTAVVAFALVAAPVVANRTWSSAVVGAPNSPGGAAVSAPTTTTIAPGVTAADEPGVTRLSDGSLVLDLGLPGVITLTAEQTGTGSTALAAGTLAVVPAPAEEADASEPAAWLEPSVDIALVDGTEEVGRYHWHSWGRIAPLSSAEAAFWARADGSLPAPDNWLLLRGEPGTLEPDEGWAISSSLDDGSWLVVGLSPATVSPEALANVTLREPITDASGARTTELRLPTFDLRQLGSQRRLFAAILAPSLGIPEESAAGPLERIPVVHDEP